MARDTGASIPLPSDFRRGRELLKGIERLHAPVLDVSGAPPVARLPYWWFMPWKALQTLAVVFGALLLPRVTWGSREMFWTGG